MALQKTCGEGACPRWTAKQSPDLGTLRDPTGASPLATGSVLICMASRPRSADHARQPDPQTPRHVATGDGRWRFHRADRRRHQHALRHT
ncbi:hypothetical protein C2E19_18830 [Pseudomonas sp. DTU12.3]|nr:hypothetical protein C2E19_18830 [Pseudomonas sp. DTU12.3]